MGILASLINMPSVAKLALKFLKDTMTIHDLKFPSSQGIDIENGIEPLRARILRIYAISIHRHLF